MRRALVSAVIVSSLLASGCLEVTGVSPDPGQPFQVVTITGTGFGPVYDPRGDAVLYDGQSIGLSAWSDGQIKARLPLFKPAGSYPLQVRAGGQLSNVVMHQIGSTSALSIDFPSVLEAPGTHLAATLTFQTSKPATVSIAFSTPDGPFTVPASGVLSANPGTSHRVMLLGLTPQFTHSITITADDGTNQVQDTSQTFTPSPHPSTFPPTAVPVRVAGQYQPGVTLLPLNRSVVPLPAFAQGYVFQIDDQGRIVWSFYDGDPLSAARRLSDGHVVYVHAFGHLSNDIVEVDLLGNHVRTIAAPGPDMYHHELRELPNGHLLTLRSTLRTISGYPYGDGPYTYPVVGDVIVEMQRDGTVVRELDLFDVLDPYRHSAPADFDVDLYGYLYGAGTKDWTHANAVVLDPSDGNLIVSLRHQDAIMKLTWAGDIVWVIGEDLPQYTGDDSWPFLTLSGPGLLPRHMHGVDLLPDGDVVCYDNGNDRPELFSRGVRYRVDTSTMQVSQVWDWIDPDYQPPLYAFWTGDMDLQPIGTFLIGDTGLTETQIFPFGNIWVRLAEVRPSDWQKVWELVIDDPSIGWTGYDADRLPGVYP